ncbi:hypothetical protein [Anaerobiospirillum sp. NML120449]|nr:hypothetical protein [Anaerobiospirillum sp. NML120449]
MLRIVMLRVAMLAAFMAVPALKAAHCKDTCALHGRDKVEL